MPNKKNALHFTGLLFVCAVLFLTSGCARQTVNFDELAQEDWTEDTVLDGLELPSDDGLSLSREERFALDSTGEFDAELNPAQKIQVERYFKYYLHKNREDFQKYLQRSEAYLSHIRTVFAEMGVPEELSSLAIVESGFNPNAVSRAGATGMWQFMRGTGLRFGLANNYWLDERRDPYKSTVAAATYLKQLYGIFNDWHLAIASYNAGEGKISRAMEHTGAEDFFELCRLNQDITINTLRLKTETQQYVPRFLAVAKIMRNLELLGFEQPDLKKTPRLVPITVGPGADLAVMARKVGLEYNSFKTLNPAYRKDISPVFGSSTAYVPAEYGERVMSWLAQPQARSFAGWQRYKVRRGDSLSTLSQRYGVSVPVLVQANNLTSTALHEGAMLLVPGGKRAPSAVQAEELLATDEKTRGNSARFIPAASASNQRASAGRPIHTVRRGENLYRIARNYGVDLASLLAINDISAEDSHLMAGQKLLIPTGFGAVAVAKSRGAYVVQKGDTLYSLAQRNKISVNELMRINRLTPNMVILPGQELLLP
jgi:membrane-bound lytic murein transglycosylase D